jgi:hypothetical protein
MKIILGILCVAFLAPPLFAACPLVTDTAFIVLPGKYDLDAGYGTTNTQTILVNAVGMVLRRGFFPQFDLAVAIPYSVSNPSGLNDIYLHAKYRFWEGNDAGLAARFDFKFNNGNIYQGLGSGDNDCRLLLIYSKKISQAHLHLNVGYVNTGVNAGRAEDDYWAYAGAIEAPVFNEQSVIFAEYVGNSSLAPPPTFVLLGMRNAFVYGSKIDLGYAMGLNDESIRNSLSGELHWEF